MSKNSAAEKPVPDVEKVVRAVDMTGRSPKDKLYVRKEMIKFVEENGGKLVDSYPGGEIKAWDGEYIDLVETPSGHVMVGIENQPIEGSGDTYVETIVGSTNKIQDARSVAKGMAVIPNCDLAVVRRVLIRQDGSTLAGYRIYTKEGSKESKQVDIFFGYRN